MLMMVSRVETGFSRGLVVIDDYTLHANIKVLVGKEEEVYEPLKEWCGEKIVWSIDRGRMTISLYNTSVVNIKSFIEEQGYRVRIYKGEIELKIAA
jgi:hypothetical protein